MYQGFPRENTGFLPNTVGYHQPVIDGSQRKRIAARNMIRTHHQYENKMLLNSYGESTHLSNSSHEYHSLPKRYFFTRKDTARKNLMGNLFTRQPTICRSNSFVAGEKTSNETLMFPKLNSFNKERTDGIGKQPNRPKVAGENDKILKRQRKRNRSGSGDTAAKVSARGSPSRPGTQKISLPDLIMDIQAEVGKECSTGISESGSESDFEHEHNHKDVASFMSKHLTKGGKIFPAKHRPITPGLLDRLAQLKLPSRVRTEQWLRRLPSDPRAVFSTECAQSYQRVLADAPQEDKTWIYTNT